MYSITINVFPVRLKQSISTYVGYVFFFSNSREIRTNQKGVYKKEDEDFYAHFLIHAGAICAKLSRILLPYHTGIFAQNSFQIDSTNSCHT